MNNIKQKLNDQYLQEIGFTDLSEADKDQKIAEIVPLLLARLNRKIAKVLGEKKYEEYNMASLDKELFQPWLDKNLPNFEDLAQEVMTELKKDLNADTDKLMADYEKFQKTQ